MTSEFNLDLGEVSLHGVESGRGERVVLLHGFPEHCYSWRHQMQPLADAGFHAIAPDLRGYNLSSRPRGVGSYSVAKVVADVVQLIERTGDGKVTLVGHDWGAVIAYQLAMYHPEKLRRLIILNGPHPPSYRRALLTPTQLRMAWYVFFFQLPYFPERWVSNHDYAVSRAIFRSSVVNPESVTDAEVEVYVNALKQPGATTATINYYRALLWRPAPRSRRIELPLTVIYGAEDKFLSEAAMVPTSRWVSNLTVHRIERAGHFVQYDRPDEVNRLLLDVLRSDSNRPPEVSA